MYNRKKIGGELDVKDLLRDLYSDEDSERLLLDLAELRNRHDICVDAYKEDQKREEQARHDMMYNPGRVPLWMLQETHDCLHDTIHDLRDAAHRVGTMVTRMTDCVPDMADGGAIDKLLDQVEDMIEQAEKYEDYLQQSIVCKLVGMAPPASVPYGTPGPVNNPYAAPMPSPLLFGRN